MSLRPSLPLALAVLFGAPRVAAEGPPVTLPEPGSIAPTPVQPDDRGPRRAPSDEVTYTPSIFARDAFPLAGFHQERFYLRDPEDRVRIFPGGLLQLDARASLGRGVADVPGPRGEALQPRLAVRRARLDLGGQIHQAWSFYLSGEFAGSSPQVEYALVDIEFHRLLRLSLGQQLLPFSQANRTFEPYLPWMERPLAVRFVLPDDKDLGAMVWGDSRRSVFSYEVGIFGGDGRRANVDRAVDVVGRAVFRPLGATPSIAQHIQIGGSVLYGTRQLDRVGTPLAPLTTEGGFAFWEARRGQGSEEISILPSGRQFAFAGEVRIPVSQFDLRLEFLHTRRNTRESLAGQEFSSSERFGTLEGNALYAHLGVWLLGSPALLEPAGFFRPTRVRFPRGLRPLDERGLLLTLRLESLNATYAPGNRLSAPGDDRPSRDIKVRGFGAGFNYYAGRHMAVLLHYNTSIFPNSSVPQLDPSNLAVAPGNLVGRSGAHQLHEVGLRTQVFF
ncbi:MAG: porin [Myxococcales bacterium]|nr:OprO/OprP family phosphate-selective porin [Polyangiaceae bacterium]MDW8249227.1 porin [Myxococcales bacterium]